MMGNIAVTMINTTFEKDCGKWQEKKAEPKAFRLRFDLTSGMKNCTGYWDLEMVIYAPANYVAVWYRECWDYIKDDDLEYNEDTDEEFVKEGAEGYIKGAGPWLCEGYHDSCWRDAVETVLKKYEDRINMLHTPLGDGSFYTLIDPSALPGAGNPRNVK